MQSNKRSIFGMQKICFGARMNCGRRNYNTPLGHLIKRATYRKRMEAIRCYSAMSLKTFHFSKAHDLMEAFRYDAAMQLIS